MLGLVVIIGAAWVLGGVGGASLPPRSIATHVVRLYLGLAICAVLILLAGSYSLAIVPYVLGIAVVIGWRIRRALVPKHAPLQHNEPTVPLTVFDWLCIGGASAVALLMLVSALAPVTSWDAGVAHLALPSDYVRDGHLHLLTGNVYSAYPQALHSLFTSIFYLSGERGVMLFCWTLGLLACATLYVLAVELGGRRAGILAMAFLASSPVFMSQVGTVAIDLPFTGVVLAVLYALTMWQRDRALSWLILAGVYAGFGCGIRHTGYIVVALCAIGVLLDAKSPKATLLFCAIAFTAASPWFLRSLVVIDNPVYPLFGSVFPDEVFARHQATEWGQHESIRDTSLIGGAKFSWDLVMHPERYDGWSANPGGWVWILGIPGLITGGRAARWIGLFSLAGISSLYMLQRLARYAMPFYVPVIAVAGLAGAKLTPRSRVLSGIIVASLVYGCVLAVGNVYFKVPVVLGMESRDTYLERRLERYPVFRWVNENIPEGEIVLTLDLRSYYIDRPTFQSTESLRALIPLHFDAKAAWFSERGIRYLLVPADIIPTTRGMGLDEELASWAHAPGQFKELIALDMPRARGEGVERVTIYEVIPASPEQP